MVYVRLVPQLIFAVAPEGVMVPPGDCWAVMVKVLDVKLALIVCGPVTLVNV
jgi:hypothetical protein